MNCVLVSTLVHISVKYEDKMADSGFSLQGLDPARVNVPVIGGHAGKTIIPLISQVRLTPTLNSHLNGISFLLYDRSFMVVYKKTQCIDRQCACDRPYILSIAFAAI